MGGARSLLGAATAAVPGGRAARAPGAGSSLDDALKRLEGRGPFMGKLLAKLRAQGAGAAPATTLGGTDRKPLAPAVGMLGASTRGFMGGY
jgi:hypothetical protein